MIDIFTAQDVADFLKKYPEKNSYYYGFLLKNNPTTLIANFNTQNLVITQNEQMLFATSNNKEYTNTHIGSPYNVYIGHAKAAAKNFEKLWIRAIIYTFTTLFGGLFKLLRFNQVIQFNNTFATMNVHPKNAPPAFADMIATLTQRYPKHTLIWPRLNQNTDAVLMNTLQNTGFNFVLTKTVHIFDNEQNYMKRSHTKRDLSLLKNSGYSIVPHHMLTEQDIRRIHGLYEMLFVEKHAAFNPMLTVEYLQQCHQHHWYEFTGLRSPTGEIDAFISYAKNDDLMVCGPLGYDTEKPVKLGLYRMIIGVALTQAHEANCLYNLGSGNELFKLNRGSLRVLEYNAVHYQHLPFYRRLPWQIVAWLGQHFSQRVFQKHLL